MVPRVSVHNSDAEGAFGSADDVKISSDWILGHSTLRISTGRKVITRAGLNAPQRRHQGRDTNVGGPIRFGFEGVEAEGELREVGQTVASRIRIVCGCTGIIGSAEMRHPPFLKIVQFGQFVGPDSVISALSWAVIIITIVSIVWTLMGGMATVIWTDVVLFLVFVIGALVALGNIVTHLDVGLAPILQSAWQEGKMDMWDFDFSLTVEFTAWTAAIAGTWWMIGAYGTDQLMTQRLFCCRNAREAKKAVIASYVGTVITVLVALVGVGLWYYYQENPLTGEAAELVSERGDRIFPVFILTVIPVGLSGLIIAGIFAAAISSLDSILAALSQTSLHGFYLPMRERYLRAKGQLPSMEIDGGRAPTDSSEDRRNVFLSRVLVVFWGIVLAVLAIGMDWAANHFDHLLGLALGMAGFVSGGLMAGFFLGFFADGLKIDGRGYMFAAPLGVLTVFAITPFNEYTWAFYTCWTGGSILLIIWVIVRIREFLHRSNAPLFAVVAKTLLLTAGIAVMLFLLHNGYFLVEDTQSGERVRQAIAWPWYAPVGSSMTFLLGWLLASPQKPSEHPEQVKTAART